MPSFPTLQDSIWMEEAIRYEVKQQLRDALAAELEPLSRRLAELEANWRCGPGSGRHKAFSSPRQKLISPRPSPRVRVPLLTTDAVDDATDDNEDDDDDDASVCGCCSALDYRDATTEGEVELAPPESFLNYCMWQLGESAEPLWEPAFRQLCLLLLLQQVLMLAFVSANELHLFKKHWPQEYRIDEVAACVFAGSTVFNIQSAFLCSCTAAILLVTLVIKQEDHDFMAVNFPQQQSAAASCIFTLVWFLQGVYLPGCFAVEAVTMFANSTDSLEVVMNTLAVTFIMEVDNMLYHSFLSNEEKLSYLEQGKVTRSSGDSARSRFCANAMSFVAFALMVAHFFHLNALGSFHGREYLLHWTYSCFTSYFPLYGMRGALLVWLCRCSAHEHILVTLCRGLVAFFGIGLAGCTWYMFTTCLALGNALYMIDDLLAMSQLRIQLLPVERLFVQCSDSLNQ